MGVRTDKNCPKCNTELDTWTVVCPKCGHVLLDTPDPSTMTPPPTIHPEPSFYTHSMEKCPKCQSTDILHNQALKVNDQKVTITLERLMVSVLVDVCRACGYAELHLDNAGLQALNHHKSGGMV